MDFRIRAIWFKSHLLFTVIVDTYLYIIISKINFILSFIHLQKLSSGTQIDFKGREQLARCSFITLSIIKNSTTSTVHYKEVTKNRTMLILTRLHLVPLVRNILPNYWINPSNKSTVGRRNSGFHSLFNIAEAKDFHPLTLWRHILQYGVSYLSLLWT